MRVIIILITFIFLFSCKKSGNLITLNKTTTTDSTFIDKIIEYDSTYYDLRYKTTTSFVYDNLKRVITVNDSCFSNGLYAQSYESKMTISYLGTDTLPYKSYKIYTTPTLSLVDTTTTFYIYTAQGAKIRDSIITTQKQNGNSYTSYKTVIDYNYSGNMIIRTTNELNITTSQNKYVKDTAYVNSFGNINRCSSRIPSFMLNQSTSFDDKPNALTSIKAILNTMPNASIYYSPKYFRAQPIDFVNKYYFINNNNNVVDRTNLMDFYTPSGIVSACGGGLVTYAYLPNGYPTNIITSYIVCDKMFFVYKTL